MTPGFVATSPIIAVFPRTGVLYTLPAGLSRGNRAGIVAGVGCTLGVMPHMAPP